MSTFRFNYDSILYLVDKEMPENSKRFFFDKRNTDIPNRCFFVMKILSEIFFELV